MSDGSDSVSSASSEKEEGPEYNLDNPDVVTKYKTAGTIANNALEHVISLAVAGAKIVDLCQAGDQRIAEETGKVFNKPKGIEKGTAFPTCVSVNNCVGHYSPLLSEGGAVLADGDLVKIDLGVHVDGCPAVVAHSFVVGASADAPASGRNADVIAAASTAVQAIIRTIKAGVKNTDITALIGKVAADFDVRPMEGVLSHEMKRWVVDGNKSIISKATVEHKTEEFEFANGMVFGIDVVMSSGEGASKEKEMRTTVYKRAVDVKYKLKSPASRATFSEINKKFPALPFTLRALEDEKRGRLGIIEMLKHEMVFPYPVLFEDDGVAVAQSKVTLLVMPSGTVSVICGKEAVNVTSEKSVTDAALQALLAKSATAGKKKKNKKKKGGKKGGKEEADGEDEEGDEEEEAPAPAPAPAAKKGPAAAAPAASPKKGAKAAEPEAPAAASPKKGGKAPAPAAPEAAAPAAASPKKGGKAPAPAAEEPKESPKKGGKKGGK